MKRPLNSIKLTLNDLAAEYHAPLPDLSLQRYPLLQQQNLRAWDAADEYLLGHFMQQLGDSQAPSGSVEAHTALRILILNDAFGALTCAVTALAEAHSAEVDLVVVSDSCVSLNSTRLNMQHNGLCAGRTTLSHRIPPNHHGYDWVMLKIPKSAAMLEYQLGEIRGVMDAKTHFAAAAMTRTIHRSTLQRFERIIGSTRTSLARKKARLVLAEFDSSVVLPHSDSLTLTWHWPETNWLISAQANVFARQALDNGARLLLQHFPSSRPAKIIDLGCGNGVLGMYALKRYADAAVLFYDESWQALQSAQHNVATNLQSEQTRCKFVLDDCLSGQDDASIDLVLCNPPFHQQHTITEHIAWQMFKDAYRVLKPGGELRLVANRHLGYHRQLQRLFGNHKLIASNAKFVILRATRAGAR